MHLLSPVSAISGIGKKSEALMNNKGIYTIQDLLFYIPRAFKDYSKIVKIAEADKTESLIFASVKTTPKISYYQGKTMVRFKVSDGETDADVFFFNMPYIREQIDEKMDMYLYGHLKEKNGKYSMINPEFQKNADAIKDYPLMPVYKQIAGISQWRIIKTLQAVLEALEEEQDYLSADFKSTFALPNLHDAHRNLHFPHSIQVHQKAIERFGLEETLVFLCMLDEQTAAKKETNIFLAISDAQHAAFLKAAGFPMTKAQIRVMKAIAGDFNSGKMMNRLIQGDVGCGKTIVAFYAMFINAINGYQSVMMAPTEILAKQHFSDAVTFFSMLGIQVALVTGSDTANQRKQAQAAIKSGEVQVVIGTHALVYSDFEYKALNLAITDEQHRFGVAHRARLSDGNRFNMLVMSATPIPRTLSLIIYSDMDISIIDELPKGRKPINTHIVEHTRRSDMYRFVQEQISCGHQAYVVCPLIDSDEIVRKTVNDVYQELKKKFKFERIGILHGQLKASEKEETIQAFTRHEIDILVSTTVIEVGVHVKNATVMVIEDAERFGLATLHQLRGRVGRGSKQSYCFLVCERSTERLDIIRNQSDGFKIAEKDLELRGPGQFLGYSQHGIGDFYMSRLIQSTKSLAHAKEIYEQMKKGAYENEYRMARQMAQQKYKQMLEDISLN